MRRTRTLLALVLALSAAACADRESPSADDAAAEERTEGTVESDHEDAGHEDHQETATGADGAEPHAGHASGATSEPITYPRPVTRLELPERLGEEARQRLRRAENNGRWTTTVGGVGIVETQQDRNQKDPGFQATIEPLEFGRFDPIVAPGVERFGHEHDFMGGDALHPGIDSEELVTDSQSSTAEPSAGGFGDKSLYWMPAVYIDGERVAPLTGTSYYRNPSGGKVAQIPEGLRMIGGDASATGAQGGEVGFFEEHRNAPNKSLDGVTHWRNGEPWSVRKGFHVRVNFPEWWDGEHLWLPGSEHMSYERTDTHTVRLPQVFVFFRYDEPVEPGDEITLGGPPGAEMTLGAHAFHADFFYGWDPEILEHLHDELINGDRSAGRLEMVVG